MTEGHRKRVQELLAVFAGQEEIASIGQISPRDAARLAWGSKHGLVRSERRPWPGPVVGTCLKTWYVRIGC